MKERKVVFKIVDTETSSGMFFHTTGFNLIYQEGTKTTAPKHTLGIFCFKTKRQAKHFISLKGSFNRAIMRVIPIGRGKVPKLICLYGGLLNFYKDITAEGDKRMPPNGTICYPAVKVLKEVK